MARPQKIGLDYFPMNVDFFDDDKIKFVCSRFDEKGELISLKLLCKIFKSGYYINWNEDFALLFTKDAGKNITVGLVNDVVNELLKRGFFNAVLFQRFGILTSNGIQCRYEKICKDSKRATSEISEKYRLIGLTPEEIKLKNSETQLTMSESTQSKVKESKVKESKVKESKGKHIPPESEFLAYCKDFLKEKFLGYENSLKAKYAMLVADGWHDGYGNEIKNWKTKIQNIIPHLKFDNSKKENGNSNATPDRYFVSPTKNYYEKPD